MKLPSRFIKGDTIIEISFAIAIFSLVSIISIGLMNNGLAMAEASLEYTMARNEIDSQAEALRFIHNSYYSELELVEQPYKSLWEAIVGKAINPNNTAFVNHSTNFSICDNDYGNDDKLSRFTDKAFVINTRKINPSKVAETIYTNTANFKRAQIHPRLIYNTNAYQLADETATTIKSVEGLWILAVKSDVKDKEKDIEYYDFHIRACWRAPGHSAPSFIATIVRLYNPLYVEAGTK